MTGHEHAARAAWDNLTTIERAAVTGTAAAMYRSGKGVAHMIGIAALATIARLESREPGNGQERNG